MMDQLPAQKPGKFCIHTLLRLSLINAITRWCPPCNQLVSYMSPAYPTQSRAGNTGHCPSHHLLFGIALETSPALVAGKATLLLPTHQLLDCA